MIDVRAFDLPAPRADENVFAYFDKQLRSRLGGTQAPLRFAVTESGGSSLRCEVGVVDIRESGTNRPFVNIFAFRPRVVQRSRRFTTVLVVPTGVGAEIGGHAGDATPAARLLAQVSDSLVTHPNVVNASDINEMPDNALYVEGSLLTRLMMGTIGLSPASGNRILALVENHPDESLVHGAINAVNAARASAGIDVGKVVVLESPMRMDTAYTGSGRAVGVVSGLDCLLRAVEEHRGDYDAIALATVINIEGEAYRRYFASEESEVNPYGGVEAMLTHAIAGFHDLQAAHAPMHVNRESFLMQFGIMDPRKAAEGISLPCFFSVLKGLHRSPRVVSDPEVMDDPAVVTARDIGCLVIPDGCLGLPTLAARAQQIPIVVVEGNRTVMGNDLRRALQGYERLYVAANYLEAAGVVSALRAGIAMDSLHRNHRLKVPIERFPRRLDA